MPNTPAPTHPATPAAGNRKTVWVGDPCYIIPDAQWSDALKETLFFGLYPSREVMETTGKYAPRTKQNGVFITQGFHCAVSATAHGDGYYGDDHGNSYGVDAGMLGAFLLPDGFSVTGELLRLGHVFHVPDDFALSVRYENGDIIFPGVCTIITDPGDDDEA